MAGVEALTLLLLLGVVVYLLFLLGTRNHDHWKRRGVPGPEPVPYFGTQAAVTLFRTTFLDFFHGIYQEYRDVPCVGLLSGVNPGLMVRTPELVKRVLTKDFEYFRDRGLPHDEELDPLSAHLFNIEGVRWRALRIKMTPTFTSGKMKRMFPLMRECGRELGAVVKETASQRGTVNFKDVLGRYSIDVIGTCAFGLQCNSFKDPDAEFRRQGMSIFAVTVQSVVRAFLFSLFPTWRWLNGFLKNTSLEQFFLGIMRENLRFREESKQKRGDFLDLLLQLKNQGSIVDDSVDVIEDQFLEAPVLTSSEELKFTENLLTAQAFVFFVAGFESSSTTMSFCLLELAHHPEIQKKVQDEIDAVLSNYGDITYQALGEMTYLDKVVAETLRKYPPLSVLVRRSIKPYPVPGTKLQLETRTRIYIPVYGLHYDPAYYPDPHRFDPERFSPEAKAARPQYTYLPFGEGPRNCLGLRFGLLQTKLGLVNVLARCNVQPSRDTQYPVKFKKGTVVTASADDCNLIVTERTM